MWRGIVDKTKKDAYIDYLNETGLQDYASVDGNEGVWLLCRERGDKVEFVTVTRWRSMDAVRAFAGNPPEKARYYPRDAEFLETFEPEVEHYELISKA
jgi:heme-degrading monooxygenase HmoA